MKRFAKGAIFLSVLLTVNSLLHAQNYVFASLKGSHLNISGWNHQGIARVQNIVETDSSEIVLTTAYGNQSGALFYNQPIDFSLCNNWKAEFDFRMFDGTGADGIAFCFLDVPPVGFVVGGGMGIPATANGLKVCFDTYNNCVNNDPNHTKDDMPKIEIRWGVGYEECADGPTYQNSNGKLNLRTDAYHHAAIVYHDGNISVSVDSVEYLKAFQKFDYPGYLGFTGSTGGQTDNQTLKNIVIYTDSFPPSDAGLNAAICSGNSTQIGVAANSAYSYSWFPSAGVNDTSIANPIVTLENPSPFSLQKKYYVKTFFAAHPGCNSLDSVIVSINPKPVADFAAPDICLTDAVATFTDLSHTTDPNAFPMQYRWYFDDRNVTSSAQNISSRQNPDHTYTATGVYNVSLNITTNNGCIDSITKPFTVNGANPQAKFELMNEQQICSGNTLQLRNTSSVNFGDITRIDVLWDALSAPSNIQIDTNPSFNKIYRHVYDTFYTAPSKNVTIRLLAYSGKSCVDVVEKTVTVYALPRVSFASVDPVCANTAPFVLNGIETSGNAGKFYFTGLGVDSSGNFSPSSGAGSHSITYTYVTNDGCVASVSQNIKVVPVPSINVPSKIEILEKHSAILPAKTIGTALTYQWQPSIFLDSAFILQPTTTPLTDITYTLTVTSSSLCTTSANVFVKLLLLPEIPNIFSPNNDGINDTWLIKNINLYENCSVDIYNRYGQLVFHSIGYNKPWDGTFNGSPLPVGTYYYVINTKKEIKRTGSLVIIR